MVCHNLQILLLKIISNLLQINLTQLFKHREIKQEDFFSLRVIFIQDNRLHFIRIQFNSHLLSITLHNKIRLLRKKSLSPQVFTLKIFFYLNRRKQSSVFLKIHIKTCSVSLRNLILTN